MSLPKQELSEQIEQLVRQHLEATRRTAAAAVERALSSATEAPRTRANSSRRAKPSSSARRSASELSALGERLYEEVCAHPGETMSALAPRVGETARDLWRPMAALKRAQRIRSVGARHLTRYYPMVDRGGGD